jgi:hypothetical protein
MRVHHIPHGFTYIYRKDARGVLEPANRNWVFQNYTEARDYLNEFADPRYTYYLSEVPYA